MTAAVPTAPAVEAAAAAMETAAATVEAAAAAAHVRPGDSGRAKRRQAQSEGGQ
ncbi:MAG: hypothetical protein KGM15_14155 [Pseudomonadota bacterium]|nr:hypothetical protein [Pseudomonadota bacterium]